MLVGCFEKRCCIYLRQHQDHEPWLLGASSIPPLEQSRTPDLALVTQSKHHRCVWDTYWHVFPTSFAVSWGKRITLLGRMTIPGRYFCVESEMLILVQARAGRYV